LADIIDQIKHSTEQNERFESLNFVKIKKIVF